MKTPPRSLPGLALLTAGLLTSQFAAANTALWIGNPGASASTNWSDNANWNNVGAGGAGALQNDAKFGFTGSAPAAGTVTSVIDADQRPFSLQYSNNTLAATAEYHTTWIPDGRTLSVGGSALTIGGVTVASYRTIVNLSGGGTLLLENGATIGNNQPGSTGNSQGTLLDLSGLTNFLATNITATITVGGGARSSADFRLADGSNFVNVATFNANTPSSSSSVSGTVALGSGTNIFHVGAFNIAGNRGSCTLNFPGATGGLRVRGVGGTDADRATMTVGNRNNGGGSGNNMTGTLSLDGHPVDMKLGTLTLGLSGSNPSGTATGNGVLSFDTGTIDATNINLAICSGTTASVQANGTINVGATATLIVGEGGISLANQNATSGAATGTLNVNGGVVQVSGNIRKTTAAGTGNINLTAGALVMLGAANTIGTAAIPLNNLNLTDATLTLPALNGTASVTASAVTTSGGADTINLSAIPPILSYPAQFTLISYGSLNNNDFALGTLPGAFQGYLSNNVGNLSVDLVVTNGPATVRTLTWRGTPSGLWDTTSLNWLAGVTPTFFNQNDGANFDDSLAGTSTVNLTTNLSTAGVTVNNSAVNYTFTGAGKLSGTMTLTKSGTGSLTLSQTGGDDFSGGVTVNGGTLILDNANSSIAGGLNVAAGATAQVGNDGANGVLPAGGLAIEGTLAFKLTSDLDVATAITGNGGLKQSGSGKVTLSAAGNSYTGDTIVSAGVLALTGTGTISNSARVAATGATLDVSGASGTVRLNTAGLTNANLTLNKNGLPTPVNVASLEAGGAANAVNVTTLPAIGSYPVTITLVQAASPISGFNFTLGTLPAATPAYAGSIVPSADQTAVQLTLTAGPVSLRPAVFWTGADAPNLKTNWSDRLNWQLPGAPTAGESAVFTDTAATSASSLTTAGGGTAALAPDYINNRVDTSVTIASLIYSNLNDAYHNTELAPGQSLNLTNTLTIGSLDTGTTAQHGFVNISGAATLAVNNTNASVQVWNGSASVAGSRATLDLSALDNFTATAGRLTVGACAVNNAVNRPSGALYLAKTNTLTLGFQTTTMHAGTTTGNAGIAVADCNGNAGSASSIYLGQVNSISADTIGIGRQKASAHLLFNPIHSNTVPYPSVTFSGFSSSRVSDFSVGDGVGNTGTTTLSADADFTGGWVNLAADTINLGRASGGATGGGTTTGALLFDAGTVTANTLNLGAQPVTGAKVGVGHLTVSSNEVIGTSGKLVVNGDLNIAVNANSATTAGTLNINNGSVQANNIVAGLNDATSTINLNGGTLIVSNTAGTPAAPLTALNLTGGTLQLNADGNATIAALVATTITPNGTTLLNIGAITGVNATSTIPLISYTGTDPFANLTLGTYPAGYAVSLEDNTGNSTIDLRVVSTSKPKPFVTGFGVVGTTLTLQGTNGASGGEYVVLGSTNVALPLAQWTPLFTNVFAPDGSFNLSTNILNPALPRQFFILSQ